MSTPEHKLTIIQKLAETPPVKIVSLPEVADRFKSLYSLMNGGDNRIAALKYEAEKFHFMKLLQDLPKLQNCTKLSLYGCFLDAAVNGLSFDPAMKHLYIVSYKHKVMVKDEKGVQRETWEERANLQIAGPGELTMRVNQGQIKYADNGVLVYRGDKFSQGVKDNVPYVNHEAVFPRETDEIIAAYLRITRIDGSVDFKVMGVQEILNLKAFSKDPNSLAWTKGFSGMVLAKLLKFSFGSYPKVKLGQFSQLQSQLIKENVAGAGAVKIDYGMPDTANMALTDSNADMSHPDQEITASTADILEPGNDSIKTGAPFDDNEFANSSGTGNKETLKFDDDQF